VAVEILEHGNGSVRFPPRRLPENDAPRAHRLVVGPEIIRMEEQEDASAGLVAHLRKLLVRGSLGEQDTRLGRAWRGHQNPSLLPIERLVRNQREAELAGEIADRLVIVADEKSHVSDMLAHGIRSATRAIVRGPCST